MKTGRLTAIIEKNLPSSPDEKREYIGASSIGSPCLRQIYYSYHKYKRTPYSTRQQRIFDIGKMLESLVVKSIQDSGIPVVTPHEVNHFLELFDGEIEYFRGHIDGLLPDWDAILEIKTMNNASWNKFAKQGIQLSHPIYYSQVQAYMGMSGLKKSYVIGLNKDTAAFHDEEVNYKSDHYQKLKIKAKAIHSATTEPPKIHTNPSFYLCKMCKFNKECHE